MRDHPRRPRQQQEHPGAGGDCRRTAIAAHRGGALLWPENSATAFHETARLEVDYVEFDVHRTRDGVLVVHHDATVDRMTGGRGAIRDLDATALSALTINGTGRNGAGGDRIPALDEVIAIFAPTAITLRLEIKPGPDRMRYPGIEREIAATLERHDMVGRTVISSFLLGPLKTLRAETTPAGVIWLVSRWTMQAVDGVAPLIAIAQDAAVRELGLPNAAIDAAVVAACARAGMRLGAFGAHDEAAIRRVLGLGLTVFTTDDPVLALRLRDGSASTEPGAMS